jgi:hypothetical protein
MGSAICRAANDVVAWRSDGSTFGPPAQMPIGSDAGLYPESAYSDQHRSRCEGATTVKLTATMMLTVDGV